MKTFATFMSGFFYGQSSVFLLGAAFMPTTKMIGVMLVLFGVTLLCAIAIEKFYGTNTKSM